MANKLVLIGAEHSYFTGKVRGYLRWKGVAFTEQLATAEVYMSTILPRVGWPVIPVLRVAAEERRQGGESGGAAAATTAATATAAAAATDVPVRYIQDTSDIIDAVELLFPALPPVQPPAGAFPGAARLRVLCALVELLADCWLLLPAMHYRWNFPEQRAFVRDAFASMTGEGAVDSAMAQFGGTPGGRPGAKDAVGAAAALGPAVERSFETLLDLLQAHFGGAGGGGGGGGQQGQERLFLLGGATPSLADFAMMGPFYAHLFRDPVPGALMKLRAPRVAAWVERVMGISRYSSSSSSAGGDDGGADGGADGEDGDATHPLGTCATLEAVVGHMLREYVPVLRATAALFAGRRFADGARVPRGVGSVRFALEGATGTRAAMTFDLWMAQRVFDELREGAGDEGDDATEYLRGAFGEAGAALLDLAPGFAPDGELRVKREQNLLFKGYRDPGAPYSEFEGGQSKL